MPFGRPQAGRRKLGRGDARGAQVATNGDTAHKECVRHIGCSPSIRKMNQATFKMSARPMALLAILLLGGLSLSSQNARDVDLHEYPRTGRQTDGGFLLPNGWSITPAGEQISLSTLPMSLALSPDEEHALVLNGGFLPPTISVIDLAATRETARVPVPDGWLGITFNKAGDKVYIGGGSRVSVFEFSFREGELKLEREFPVVPPGERAASDHVGDVMLSADERFLYAANLFRNSVAVLNTQTGFVVQEIRTGFRPYRLLLGLGGKTLLVSHWAESSIGVYALSDGRLIQKVSVGLHPTDMLIQRQKMDRGPDQVPLVGRLFVACANTNSVSVVGITEGNRFELLERIPVAPTPRAPAGSTPTALALSADSRLLYTVCSDNNTIVVADVSQERAELLGAVPTGWYPTDVAATSDGRLLYLSGKGQGSHPAPRGPDPSRRGEEQQYVAALQTGSLGILPPLGREHLIELTRLVIENTPYDDHLLSDAGIAAGNPIPTRPGLPSPIKHVIYVVKENRTYDQVLGDLESGDGKSELTVFGNAVAPNHHKLAREFVLFDNFYTAGDVSADGQNWSAAAIANDYVQKLWPSYYGRRRRVYDFEGGEPTAVPTAGYLWTNALAAGLSVRNYGFWAWRNGNQVTINDPGLAAHTNSAFVPFDLDYSDQKRVDEFLREFTDLEAAGKLPQLMMVRLPGDHTAGRAPGKPTARAMMADHDYALGRLVEAVSKSEAWGQTAIFVVEDDAQDGADHIDSHRSPAFVASPYAKRGFVDHAHYSTASVLRTIELILGLRPMTQFDAAAPPMADAFTAKPDVRHYEAVKPKVSSDEKNPPGVDVLPRRVKNDPPSLFALLPSSWRDELIPYNGNLCLKLRSPLSD